MQLFEPKPQTDPSKNFLIVREHIKRACYHTGILGKPTVLLIHEGLGEDCLQDVACLMNEGENDKEINPKNMGFVLSLSTALVLIIIYVERRILIGYIWYQYILNVYGLTLLINIEMM